MCLGHQGRGAAQKFFRAEFLMVSQYLNVMKCCPRIEGCRDRTNCPIAIFCLISMEKILWSLLRLYFGLHLQGAPK